MMRLRRLLALVAMAPPLLTNLAWGQSEEAEPVVRVQLHALPLVSKTALGPGVPPGSSVPEEGAQLHVRPDFQVDTERLSVLFRPRVIGSASQQSDRRWDPVEWAGEVFVNEWRLRANLASRLFVSYGREVLRWGPSPFLSLSNPFMLNTGRSNPEIELGGTDYFQLLSVIGEHATSQVIVNTARARGEQSAVSFQPTAALKLDYDTDRWGGSLIFATERYGRRSLGWYATATLSDALLVYTEGALSRRTRGLYPQRDADGLLGWAMAPTHGSDKSANAAGVVGLAYTFEFGTTVTAEYLYNGEGYSANEADQHTALLRDVGGALAADPTLAPLAGATLGQALAPNQRTLRRNYASVQLAHLNFLEQADLFLRYTQNLDDRGGLVAPIVQWNVVDAMRLFFIGAYSFGSKTDEFRGLVHYQAMCGFRYFLM